MRLLGKVVERGLEHGDQLHMAGGFAGLAGETAAAILGDASRPDDSRPAAALRLLEFGRARVLAQLLEPGRTWGNCGTTIRG